MKNARTPWMQVIRKSLRILQLSKKTGIPTDELLNLENSSYFSRREFIGTSLKAGAALGLAGTIPFQSSCQKIDMTESEATDSKKISASRKGKKYSIAIIGGGIAGLHAAWVFKKAGVKATVYEASSRTGGRILTAYNIMGDNLYTELGGEFIDSDHQNMRSLAKEFKLDLIDAPKTIKGLKPDDFFIDDTHYTIQQAIAEFSHINTQIEQDLLSINDDYSVGSIADAFDKKSIDEYLDGLGCSGWFRKLLQVAYESEYGYSTAEQSSLNFITFIGTDISDGEFHYFGSSDERYKIKGGNQQLVDKLAFNMQDRIMKDHQLTRIKQEGNGYKLSFTNGKEETADFVILTLPFSMLKDVEMNVVMSPEKVNAIQNLKYATNSKMLLGFDKRIWRDKGYGGYMFNNLIQNGWDNSLGQNGDKGRGGYTIFVGGLAGLNMNASQYDMYIDEIDRAYNGARAMNNSKRSIIHWPTHPFTKGSYAVFTTGTWIGLSPYIAEPVGNIYFAGEHCSEEFQGFMEGGAETGKAAAEIILELL
jgi:monoamine oxidase